jgi:four helix bundle protein
VSSFSLQQTADSTQLFDTLKIESVTLKSKIINVMKNYRNLVVWEKAHKLVLSIYAVTQRFPNEERFGLTSQIRRAATSTPTNIAEGCGKSTQKDFAHYLEIAFASMQEVQYLSFLSFELKYLDALAYSTLEKNITEVKAMLFGLIQKIRKP